MTSGTLDLPPVAERREAPPDRSDVAAGDRAAWRGRAEWVAAGVAFVVWVFHVLPARGGWEAFAVPTASLLLVPSLVVLRPWRHCSARLLLLAAAPALGALVVAALSPYGDGGPISLSRWGYFGGLLLATASFARTPTRRAAVAAALLLGAVQQYASAWLPWWGGGGSIDGPMFGTLYSANPFGSLMLAFALVAGGVALLAPAPLSRLGWLATPLSAVAVVLSGARAAMMLLACGAVVLGALAVRAGGGRGLLRAALLVALCWGVLTVSTSSLFFDGGQDALAATASKQATGQSLDSTTGVRLEYWSAAWGEFRDHPVLGGGSGSYMGDSRLRMPPAAERSPFAHNEVLGALAEGGVVLGLPVLVLFLVAAAACLRRVLGALTDPRSSDPVALACALAAGALLVHGLADFALSFPAVLALLGVLLGVVLARRDAPGASGGVGAAGPSRVPRAEAAAALLVLLLCGGYLGTAHDRAGVSGRAAASADGASLPLVRDGRVIVATARGVADGEASPEQARTVARELAPLARLDGNVEAVRLQLLAASGRRDEARAGAQALARRSAATTPLLLLPYAEQLAEEADRQQAFDLLTGHVHARAAETGRVRTQLLELLVAARALAGPQEPGWSCTVTALRRADALPAGSPLLDDLDTGALRRCAAWAGPAYDLLGDPS